MKSPNKHPLCNSYSEKEERKVKRLHGKKKNLRWTQKNYRILKATGRQGGSVGAWGGITGQGSGKLGSQISQELGLREVSSPEMAIK